MHNHRVEEELGGFDHAQSFDGKSPDEIMDAIFGTSRNVGDGVAQLTEEYNNEVASLRDLSVPAYKDCVAGVNAAVFDLTRAQQIAVLVGAVVDRTNDEIDPIYATLASDIFEKGLNEVHHAMSAQTGGLVGVDELAASAAQRIAAAGGVQSSIIKV